MAEKGRQYLLLADEDLMYLAYGGDKGAFAGLYDRHGRTAYSLAYRGRRRRIWRRKRS